MKKKIFMIIVLIAFLAAIGVVLVKVNKKSVEKNSEISNNTLSNNIASDLSNSTSSQSEGIIRKSAQKAKADTSNMLEITDNFFIEQTNDLYINMNDYVGKTIKIAGLIYSYKDSNGDTCYAVVRNTPGCCGADGLAGVDIRYYEDYPKDDTWVEVIGVLEKDTISGTEIPALQVASMEIKEKGTTFVTN